MFIWWIPGIRNFTLS